LQRSSLYDIFTLISPNQVSGGTNFGVNFIKKRTLNVLNPSANLIGVIKRIFK